MRIQRVLKPASFGVCILTLTAIPFAASPARADRSVAGSWASCDQSAPCQKITQSGAGQAILGIAGSNSAITGKTTAFLSKDPGTNVGIGGIVGIDVSPFKGAAHKDFTAGVFGYSIAGEAVLAVSPSGQGIVGTTYNEASKTKTATNGVVGLDQSLDDAGANNAIFGASSSGYGVVGVTANPSKADGFTSVGVFGSDGSADGGQLNIGLWGVSSGIALRADGFAAAAAPGQPQYPAVSAHCAGAPAMIATNGYGPSAADVMSLDCSGNLILAGTLTTNATPLVATHGSGGVILASFTMRNAQPTLEDEGEAQLVNGTSTVKLDPAFASTIDARVGYSVFITAEGDSRGLFVTAKARDGFSVRESQNGRTTLAFAYRIVAKPLDATAARLPRIDSVARPAHASVGVPSKTQYLEHLRPIASAWVH